MSQSGKGINSKVLKRIFGYTQPYRKIFRIALVLTISLAMLSPVRPLMTQEILDRYIADNHVEAIIWMSIGMIAVLILQSSLQFMHTWNTNLLGQYVIRDLRNSLFAKMQQFNVRFFDKTPVGTSVTRSISDMETISDIFSEGLLIIIGDLLQLLVIVSVMFYVDWRLALISLSTIPLLMIATNIFKNKIKITFNDVRTQVAALNTFVQEHLTGMRIVQIFGRQNEEMEKFETINHSHRLANIRSVWYYSIFFPVVEILSAISIGLLVWWGAGGVIREEVSFGNLIAFIMYINMLFRPIRELADKFNTLQMGMVSSERIFKVVDEDDMPADKGNYAPEKISGKIEFRNVWFAYNYHNSQLQDPNWILRDISFILNPGEMVALVGATGAGKSTIISLLNRFYEVSKGEILLDDVNIFEYKLENLRKHIGLVMQDVFLFSDTVINNISLHNKNIPLEKVKDAAGKLGAAGFIEQLPGTYDFQVQERGIVLSTGQRQLISFIRAYVYDPAILILDEATSNVDSETEALITKATENITSKRTSIVIAHRLATILNAHTIIVLDHGEIIEQGTHAQLISLNGAYKRLFEIQFKTTGLAQKNY